MGAHIRQHYRFVPVAGIVAACIAMVATSAPIFEDSFANLNSWPNGTLTNGLTYLDIAASDKALTAATTSACTANFNGAVYANSTLYFSAMAAGLGNADRLLFFSTSSGSSSTGAGFDCDGTNLKARIGSSTGNSISKPPGTVFIIGKFEFDSVGSNIVTIWINPTNFSDESALAASAWGSSSVQLAGSLYFASDSGIYPRQFSTSAVYDEIRLSTVLSEVVPLAGNHPASYAVWASGHHLGQGMTGDDDGDGKSNLYEYAFYGNPTNRADTGFFTCRRTSDKWELVYACRLSPVPGLFYSIEICTNLTRGGWSTNGVTGSTGSGTLNDDYETVTNWIEIVSNPQFARLSVSTNAPPPPPLGTNQTLIAESLRSLVDTCDVSYDSQGNVTALWLQNINKDTTKPGVDDQTFRNVLSSFPKLVDIHIECQPLSDTGLSILQNFPNLRSAEFHYMDNVGSPSADFTRFVAGARGLKTFEVKHHFKDLQSTVALTSVLAAGGFPQLERLVLDQNAAAWEEGAALLAATAPGLKELETHRSNLRNSDVADIAAACPALEVLWLRPLAATGQVDVGVMPTLSTLTSLRDLRFYGAYDQMTMPYTGGLDYLISLPDLLTVYMPTTWKDGGTKQQQVDTFISAYRTAQGHKVTVYFGSVSYN